MGQNIFPERAHSIKPLKKRGAELVKKLCIVILCSLTLTSCGTAQGFMYGASEVLNGMGKDARAVGSLFN